MWHQHQRRSDQRQYYPLIPGMTMMMIVLLVPGLAKRMVVLTFTMSWLSILPRLHQPSHDTHESKYFICLPMMAS
jgi:hypothetical protein